MESDLWYNGNDETERDDVPRGNALRLLRLLRIAGLIAYGAGDPVGRIDGDDVRIPRVDHRAAVEDWTAAGDPGPVHDVELGHRARYLEAGTQTVGGEPIYRLVDRCRALARRTRR